MVLLFKNSLVCQKSQIICLYSIENSLQVGNKRMDPPYIGNPYIEGIHFFVAPLYFEFSAQCTIAKSRFEFVSQLTYLLKAQYKYQ